MAEPCKLSAVTLALRTLVNNEELTRRLADLAEESNQAYLYSDALKEGAIEGTEGGGKLANEYTLKKESADIKFKAVLFGGVLANTKQGDEALDLLMQEIRNTHGTVSEGLDLIDLISKMDLSGLEDAAKVVFNTTTEEASKIIDDIRVKISNYVGSEYSIVTSGSSIKAKKVIDRLDKEIDDAISQLDEAKAKLGEKTYKDVNKDLKKLQSYPHNNKKYRSTKEGRKVVNKLADKYGKAHNKRILENYLSDIIQAQKTVEEQSNRLETIAKEYTDALKGDLKLIESGQNPINYVGADAEWKFIKGFDDSVSQRAKQYGQYALARTLLTDNGEIPQSIYDSLVRTIKTTTKSGIVNYLDEPLTEEWILDKDRTLEELMTRAYTNTQQLVSDGNLRDIYRQQLIALATDGELESKDVKYIQSLLNTMKFSNAGAGFSDVLKYNALLQSAKDLGIDVGKRSGQTLWREIVSFMNEDAFDTLLKRGNTITLRDGLQMTHRELLELVSNMAGDLNLKKAIATNQRTDNDLLRAASKYLLGDNIEGAKRLKELIGVAKEAPVTDDIRGVILKAITGKNVPEKTKVAFFDFRKELKAAEDVKLRAEYMDKLSDANKIEIPNATIPEITTSSVDGLIRELGSDEWKGGYLLVNDSQWKMNEVLEQALYEVNYGRKAEDRIQVMFPKGGLMGQFKSEGGKLIFKTPYSSMFNEFLQTVALRTFGEAGGDSKFTKELIDKLTKGDLDAIAEVNKVLEEDARKYYGAMLGVDAYDDRLIPMLEETTGISFKNYDAIVDKAAFWKKVDDRFMLEGKILGKYAQEVTTVEDVLKEIESMSPQSIANELSQRFGYTIKADQIMENGLIKDDIKRAYTNYKLSQTPIELLERKGKLLSILNGGVADNITTNQFRSMMQSGDFSAYKRIFFHNVNVPDEELHKIVKQINDMIFDGLGAQVADNLVDMGYSLPLVNIRDMIYEWAMGTLDVNSGFARAFLAKNNLDPTMSTLNGILNQAMPIELRFAYDDGFKYVSGSYYDKIGRWVEGVFDNRYNSYIDILSDGTLFRDGYRRRGQTANWMNLINSTVEVNSPSVVNGKTVRQLANEYGVPLFIAADNWLDNVGAYSVLGRTNLTGGRIHGKEFVQSMINLRNTIPEGTAPHELFHSIFLTLAPEDTKYFIDEAARLYNYDERTANEMLADLFSEYFRTGTFSLPRHKASFGRIAEEKKFVAWINRFFGKMAAWLGFVGDYEKEITKLFDDILDGKLKTTKSSFSKEEIEKRNNMYVARWRDSYMPHSFNMESYNKFDGSINVDDIIKQFITDTGEEFSDQRYRQLINLLLETNNNDLLKDTVYYVIKNGKNKSLLFDLYSAIDLEREYYLAMEKAGELVGQEGTSFPYSPINTIDTLWKDLKRVMDRRPTIKKKIEEKNIYKEIKGLKGQNFDDVLDKLTGGGYGLPIEIGAVVDKDGKIISIGNGGPNAIDTTPTPNGYIFYHSHPQVGWFSGKLGSPVEPGDLTAFIGDLLKYEYEGLINPGGVVLKFKNDGTFRRAADSSINPLLQAILGVDEYARNRWGTVQAGLVTSLITGEYDNQIRGIFTPVVEKYKDKVKQIVDKYDFHDLMVGTQAVSKADKDALEILGNLIGDEVKQNALYYITHGPYQDQGVVRGIGDMFNYSNTEDSLGRYLTNGQENFGFATVNDVQQLDSNIKFEGSNGNNIARAYFSKDNSSSAGLGYDIYFSPFKISEKGNLRIPSIEHPTLAARADACYVRFNPDNIAGADDKLFSIIDKEDVLDKFRKTIIYNPGLYKALENVDENITIKDFIDALEASGYSRAGDGVREIFFDVIDGYYDEAKGKLHLFNYDDVKHINNLNPKETPNVYFREGYNRPITTREYTDPATGIKYKLTPDDFVNVRGEWRLKTEFVPIEELDKLKEFDRRVTPKFSDSDDIINDLKEKFKKEGIQNPLYIHYSLADGKAYLAEGNHRLAAAKELGMEYLPVWVDVSKKTPSGKGVKVAKPKPFGAGDFYPDTMAPSDIGIKGAIGPYDRRGYSNIFYEEPTYSKGAVDSDGRQITDQQDTHFEGSQFRDNDGNILTLYRGATDGREGIDLGENLRYGGDGHLKIFLTPDKDIVKYFGGAAKKRGTKLKDVNELQELLDGAAHRYERSERLIAKDLGNGQYEVVKQRDYLLGYDAPEGYFGKVRENGNDIIRTKIGERKEGRKRLPEVREEETLLRGTLWDIDKNLDRVLYPVDPVLAPHNLHYYEVYGLSKNPLIVDAKGVEWNEVDFNGEKMSTDKIADWAYDNGYDGVIFKNVKEQFYRDGKPLPGNFVTDDYVVFSQGQLKSVDNLTPTEGEHWRDRVGYGRSTLSDYITRLSETTNEFMEDTYSTLTAMAAIKNGAALPNSGHERQILQQMLDDYYAAFENATANGKQLSFKEAQDLKTRMGYALDMFEQNYLAPQYQRFLTPDEKNELFGLKYALGITTKSDGLDTIREYNSKIMNRYTNATKRVLDKAELVSSSLPLSTKSVKEEIEKRQQQLIEQGATMKVVNGQPIVVDIREEIVRQLQDIPSNIIGLEQVKTLGKTGLNQLSNEEVFFLLNVIELAKNAENKMNLITKTIYKVTPQLAKVDFFNTFKSVDGLPQPLRGNLLNGSAMLSKYSNTEEFDKEVKKRIFGKIKNKFIEKGQLSYDELSEIINNSIDVNTRLLANTVKGKDLGRFKKEASIIYQGAFNLYTLLKDVPKAVKDSIDDILKQQQEGIEAALNMLGDKNRLPEIMDSISIIAPDGTVKTFRKVLDGEDFNLSKTVFNTESDVIKSADEAAQQTIDRSWKESKQMKVQEENRITVEKVNNNYRDGLSAYLNEMEVVSQAERDLINTTRTSAREIAKQYTLTNKLADTDNALASINEAIMRDFKTGVLGFLGNMTQGGQLLKIFGNVGKNITEDVMKKWELVKERYRTLYNMSTEQLLKFEPKNVTDGLALNLTLYFKEIENRLGSIDGLTGGTTNRDINRAFAHLGEVVLNINSIHGLFSLMSGVEGNQILKFFRFAEPGNASRVDEFIIGGLGQQYLGGYRNYVDITDLGLNREWFNKTFASNLTDIEYTKLIQALCGFTITSPKFRWLEKIFNFVNQSNYLFRTLLSYPGQFVTIHPQAIAYWLKQTGWEKELGAEDLGAIDNIRKQTGVLNTTYNEINMFRYASPDDTNPTAFYNRYGLPDVDDLLQKEKFYTTDDISTMYSKIDNYGAQGGFEGWFNKFLRNTDAYKDNANNIIDGLFARNFKNIAFLKALQSNNYMKFATAEQFAEFMASDAPATMKKKLMDAIAESSGRNFRNILGLGFSGLDRATGGGWERNIWIGLMQMFNFRGAWGQNIARQTWNRLSTSFLMARNGLSKEGRDAMAMYIARQPEWTNFVSQLFTDLKNSWRLVKFQDNGDWPVEDDDQSIIDFIQYAYETMQFSSQRWQGIQSYGTTRILGEWARSAIQTWVDPEIYKDTIGIGALMNALSKNLGRNWKVPNLIMKTLAQDGGDEKWAYLGNEFWKLSFGTLRYLMNEDETSYGYSTELTRGRPGAIPFVISGEISEDGDKAFSYDLANTETWLNVVNWWNARQDGDTGAARAYLMNNLDSFFNASQLFGFVKNAGRLLAGSEFVGDKMKGWLADDFHIYKFGSPFDLAEVGDAVNDTEAGHQLMAYGQYRPTDARDVKILVDEVLGQANHRPGNDGFNKSMFNFDKSDHMMNLEESNPDDASMELLLSNIKYERDENFNYITDKEGNKIESQIWKMHMADMTMHMNDADYMTNSNYNFINNWVELNNDDPNYMLYRRQISEGLAGRYATQQINDLIDQHNKIHGYKKTQKLTLEKLKNGGIYDIVYPQLLSQETLITGEKTDFLTAIMQLDKAATMSANIKMVERQLSEKGDDETIKKLFNIDKKGNITLGTKYEAFLEEQAKLSQALNNGDIDKFMAETSSITRMFRDEDPYGLMTTTLVTSRIRRINDSNNLSTEQKAKAIDALLTDNYDFIQTHIPQLIDEIGDKDAAGAYIAQMNESLYDTSYIGDKLVADSEMSNSKAGRRAAVSISTKAKNLLGKLGSSAGDGEGVGGGKSYNYNFIPVRLDGARLLKITGSKGYTPVTSSAAIQAYKAHADFSLRKDINRNVKGPKTQAVTKKKQLSKLESDATKALEAES